MIRQISISLLLAAILSGCASVPMGDPQKDAQLKSFTPKSDVAGIYIYRNESFGAAVKMDVAIDGKKIGQTAAKTYLYTEVSPGPHTITSLSENSDRLDIEFTTGKIYYVWQEVKMGLLYAGTKLHLVDENVGQKGVGESKLAAGGN